MIGKILTQTSAITLFPDGRMDTRNASLYTGLSEKTLAMMRCNGTGPKFIKRGRVFYFQDDVDAWLNAQGRLTSTAQAAQKAVA
ncbi:MAG: helix-turn-helix transcriptional regulator [Pseudomonadota bacterium]